MPIYRANFAFDFGTVVRGIAAPTRILELVTNAEAHLGRQAERLAALLPRGSAVTLEDGGIDLHESRPQDLVAQIIAFCTGGSA